MFCQVSRDRQAQFPLKKRRLSVMKFKLYMHRLYKIIVLYLFISVHSPVSSVKITEQFKHTLFAKQLVILKDSTKAKNTPGKT